MLCRLRSDHWNVSEVLGSVRIVEYLSSAELTSPPLTTYIVPNPHLSAAIWMNESQPVLLIPRSNPRHVHGDRISLTDPVTRGWSIHTQHIHTPTWLLRMVFRILATLTEYLFINHFRLFISFWNRTRLSFVSLTPTLCLELTEEIPEGIIRNTYLIKICYFTYAWLVKFTVFSIVQLLHFSSSIWLRPFVTLRLTICLFKYAYYWFNYSLYRMRYPGPHLRWS